MKQHSRTLAAFVAALVVSTAADALTFFGAQGEATAVAISGSGLPATDSRSGSPAVDPLTASAASVGTTDIATAGAIAGMALLTTSADASAANGIGSAVATSRFAGAFLNSGPVSLSLDFTRLDSSSGSGTAATTLFVSLTSDGVSLFRNYVTGPSWQFSYAPVLGTTSLLDLLLSSDASAAFASPGAGDASAFGLVTLVGAVPEAPVWLLLPLGLGVVVLRRVRR